MDMMAQGRTMKRDNTPPALDDGHTVMEGATRHDLLWSSAKLIASIAVALVAALWLDGLLSKL
jgi:hypothetical protein